MRVAAKPECGRVDWEEQYKNPFTFEEKASEDEKLALGEKQRGTVLLQDSAISGMIYRCSCGDILLHVAACLEVPSGERNYQFGDLEGDDIKHTEMGGTYFSRKKDFGTSGVSVSLHDQVWLRESINVKCDPAGSTVIEEVMPVSVEFTKKVPLAPGSKFTKNEKDPTYGVEKFDLKFKYTIKWKCLEGEIKVPKPTPKPLAPPPPPPPPEQPQLPGVEKEPPPSKNLRPTEQVE